MTIQETIATLESMGTEDNRRIYARHGAGGNTYGVSFANLTALRKKIKTDHGLAQELWKSGVYEARALATMIADPASITEKQIDAWAKGLDSYCVADQLARFVANTAFARKKADEWRDSKKDFVGQTGWDIVAILATNSEDEPDEYYEEALRMIEERIHTAGNRTRHAMNGALIGIGLRDERLRKLATAAAKRIGKVVVDHGETNCKTPNAIAYIDKSWGRKKR